MSNTNKDKIKHCSNYDNDPKQCVNNKCWYYYKEKKCGINYMCDNNKKLINKRIENMKKTSEKVRNLTRLKKQSKRSRLSKKKSRRLSSRKKSRRLSSRKKSKRSSSKKKSKRSSSRKKSNK